MLKREFMRNKLIEPFLFEPITLLCPGSQGLHSFNRAYLQEFGSDPSRKGEPKPVALCTVTYGLPPTAAGQRKLNERNFPRA